jgi:amino acid adenylation domain-containing protein
VRTIPPATVPLLFQAQVARDPEATALLHDGRPLTYAVLNARANHLARRLIELGVGPERVVAVALPRSVRLIVALLAVLKAGGVYLPIDPAYPADRIGFMLADAVPTVLIADEIGDLPAGPPGCTRVDPDPMMGEFAPALPDPDDPDRLTPLRPAHPVYLMYTSGSTGVPKGVLMPGSSLNNLFAWHRAHLPIGPGVRTAQFAALGFDVSMHEILSTLVHGRTLVIPDEELRRDPAGFVNWMQQYDVAQLFVPTVVLESLCVAADEAGIPLDALRDVLQSGEALRISEPLRRFLRRRPQIRLHNQYGSTEMQDVTGYLVQPPDLDRTGTAPIGRALWNTRAYVLDQRFRPVVDGEPGELFIAGAGLARGYRGRPGLTAERFLPDPHGPAGERMYRTGDVVRTTAAGDLTFVERSDDQVKIRGFRVEIAEVEAVLGKRPEVAHLAVVARESTLGHQQLVAYVVPAGSSRLDPQEIRTGLAEVLPAHLVPAAVVVLAALPTTASGKVDRAALPAPVFGRSAVPEPADLPADDDDRPSTPEQRLLADLFAQVLGVPRIGLDDSLIALGGDSIVVMRLISLAGRAGLGITAQQVFEQPTARLLGLIARPLERAASARRPLIWLDEDQLERVQRAMPAVQQILPITAVQLGLLAQTGQGDDPYTEQAVVRLTGPLDPVRLRAAAEELVRLHPGLRTGFVVDGLPRPVQVVAAQAAASWRQTQVPANDPDRLANLVDAELNQRFDLECPPLARFHLIDRGDEKQLLITYHHLALDGWSIAILLRDLFAGYRGQAVEPSAASAADVAGWWADRDRDAALRVWRETLAGLREPTVLVPDSVAAPFRGARQLVAELPDSTTTALGQLLRGQGVTLNSAVLTVWGIVLAGLTGEDDVVFGTTVAGRPAEVPGIEAVAGMFVNTVPVRVRVTAGESFLDAVIATHREQVRLLAHLHPGLGDVIRTAGWTRSFDTLAVFENDALKPASGQELPDGLKIVEVEQTDRTHYPVALLATPGPRLRLQLTYRPDLVDDACATGILDHLRLLLESAAAQVSEPIPSPTR